MLSRRATAAVISSGWVCHSRVEPSTSASSNVTVPVGSSPMNTSLHVVSLMLASIRASQSRNISGNAQRLRTGMLIYRGHMPRLALAPVLAAILTRARLWGPRRYFGMAMTGIENTPALRVSDADRNGTLRRLHNAVALGLIDIGEFEERSAQVSAARMRAELDVAGRRPARARCDRHLRDRPGRAAGLAGLAEAPRRVDGADAAGAVRRRGLGRTRPDQRPIRGPVVVIELDMKCAARWTCGCPRVPARRSTTSTVVRRQRARPPQGPARRGHSRTSSSPVGW